MSDRFAELCLKLLNSKREIPDQYYWKDCRLKVSREKGVLSQFRDIMLAYKKKNRRESLVPVEF